MKRAELIDLKTAYVGEVLIPKAIEKLRRLENLSPPYLEALDYIERMLKVNDFHSNLSISNQRLEDETVAFLLKLKSNPSKFKGKKSSWLTNTIWGIVYYIKSFTRNDPEGELEEARTFLTCIGLVDEFKVVAELYEKSKERENRHNV